ncbi:uncharacterized protein KY384_008951 [Bacidia gigantensis]|uniref:uncharacterized protein n=1 Tax=Bacidia gigantensis TaxID=2732470 RepID=UPI001D05008A|nr:uncharacterized protein KY384_008951 [Bacidia gigantensis]KAG8525307.1 hypothetical protein KY384_008951 [Bacidia gigantensis]
MVPRPIFDVLGAVLPSGGGSNVSPIFDAPVLYSIQNPGGPGLGAASNLPILIPTYPAVTPVAGDPIDLGFGRPEFAPSTKSIQPTPTSSNLELNNALAVSILGTTTFASDQPALIITELQVPKASKSVHETTLLFCTTDSSIGPQLSGSPSSERARHESLQLSPATITKLGTPLPSIPSGALSPTCPPPYILASEVHAVAAAFDAPVFTPTSTSKSIMNAATLTLTSSASNPQLDASFRSGQVAVNNHGSPAPVTETVAKGAPPYASNSMSGSLHETQIAGSKSSTAPARVDTRTAETLSRIPSASLVSSVSSSYLSDYLNASVVVTSTSSAVKMAGNVGGIGQVIEAPPVTRPVSSSLSSSSSSSLTPSPASSSSATLMQEATTAGSPASSSLDAAAVTLSGSQPRSQATIQASIPTMAKAGFLDAKLFNVTNDNHRMTRTLGTAPISTLLANQSLPFLIVQVTSTAEKIVQITVQSPPQPVANATTAIKTTPATSISAGRTLRWRWGSLTALGVFIILLTG